MPRQPHKKVHATCEYGATTWAECDKAMDNVYADWQAMQQVILAYNLVVKGRTGWARKEKGLFPQLVSYIAGDREDMMTDDGNPSVSPWAVRLRAAIERFKAGDLPRYNQVEPTAPSATAQEA